MSSARQDALKRKLIGQGSPMILSTLVGGLGLWSSLIGGFEVVSGYIVNFQLPGTAAGWVRCHTGPVANDFMVMITAFSFSYLELPDESAESLGWMIMMDGWANVLFYFCDNLSANRGLSFRSSRLGPSDIFGIIALGPAYFFGVLAMYAFARSGYRAVVIEPTPKDFTNGSAAVRIINY